MWGLRGVRVQVARCARVHIMIHMTKGGRKGASIPALGGIELVGMRREVEAMLCIDVARLVEVHGGVGATSKWSCRKSRWSRKRWPWVAVVRSLRRRILGGFKLSRWVVAIWVVFDER